MKLKLSEKTLKINKLEQDKHGFLYVSQKAPGPLDSKISLILISRVK